MPVRSRSPLLHLALLSLLAVLALTMASEAAAQSAGDYRTIGTGNWSTASIWQTFNGTSWVLAGAAPTSASGVITIRNPHVVTITAVTTYDQVVVELGAQLMVAAGIAHTLNDGAGTDLTVNGTFINQGGTWTTNGTWAVGAGGTYVHQTTAAISAPLDKATLNATSNFIYRGSSTLVPPVSMSGRTYGNVSFESTSGAWVAAAAGAGALQVNGNFTIGTGVTYSTAQTGTMTFAGSFTNNGTLTNGAGTQVYTFSAFGNLGGSSACTFETFHVNGGLFVFTPITLAAGFTGTVAVGGQLTMQSAFTNSGTFVVNGAFGLFSGGSASGNTFTYGANADLTLGSSSAVTVNASSVFWPAVNGPTNVTVLSGGGLALTVARTVNGTFQMLGPVTGGNHLTLNGIFRIDGGSITGSPTYGPVSTLFYGGGGTRARGDEWTATSGAGYPTTVQVFFNTTLDVGSGGPGTPRQVAQNLYVASGSTISTNLTPMTVSLTVLGFVTIDGTLVLSGSAGGDLIVQDGFTNNGTFTPNGRRVTFIGGGASPILSGTSATTFHDLTVNTSNLVINSPVTVNDELALENGPVKVNASTVLTVAPGGSVTRTNGYVSGKLRKTVAISGGVGSQTFELGTTSPFPDRYAPVDLTTNSGTADFEVTASTAPGDHASIGSSGIDAAQSVNRNWTLTTPSLNAAGVDLTFHFDPADVDAGADPNLFRVEKYDAPNWTVPGVGNRTATSTQAVGVTGFSDFQVGEPTEQVGVPDPSLPIAFALSPVTPNPARGRVSASFALPQPGPARVSVIDPAGREVAVLASGDHPAGWHIVSWSGATTRGRAAPGVYWLQYQSAGGRFVRRFALMK